jgi:enediyne core biosynthesis thioesterase
MLSHHSQKSIHVPQLMPPVPEPAAEPQRTFKHQIDIYLKDSNAYTNTYFSRYFEWQGVCRERWFHKCISADMLQSQGVFITKRAHQEYLHETFPFQTVDCRLNTFEVKQCSFYLVFEFMVDGVGVSTGYQQIVFATADKRIQRLPEEVLAKMKEYELPVAKLRN